MMNTVKFTAAPALEHDAQMKKKYNNAPTVEGMIERCVVWNLCAHLAANGWLINTVDDGDDDVAVVDAKSALELVFNLDQAWVGFYKGVLKHEVFLVLGNGVDIVSDWNYSNSDDFNDAMRSFDADTVVEALLIQNDNPLHGMRDAATNLLAAIEEQLKTEYGEDEAWLRRAMGNIRKLQAW